MSYIIEEEEELDARGKSEQRSSQFLGSERPSKSRPAEAAPRALGTP